MVKIAIAGGTSPTLGHAIVSALLKNHPEHTPIILSSRPPPSTPSTTTSLEQQQQQQHPVAAGPPKDPHRETDPKAINPTSTLYAGAVEVRHVSYTSPASLAAALRDAHTVVSVLKIPDPAAMRDAQLALLRAARAAGCRCRRFAPSEWAFGGAATVDAARGKDDVWEACRAAAREAGRGRLEVARFRCGAFMNHLAVGRRFSDAEAREKALAGLGEEDGPVLWDFERGVAELPVLDGGRGHPRVTLTEIDDVGRFVAAACALTEGTWVEEMDMVGETVRVDEVVGLVRECLGVELRVVGVGREELERRAAEVEGVGGTREEVVRKMNAQFALVMLEEREGWAILKPTLNELCVNTKPLSVREYLTNYR